MRFGRTFTRAADNPISEADLDVYGRALAELSLTDLHRACYFALHDLGPFWPCPREILECLAAHPRDEVPRVADCPVCRNTGWAELAPDPQGRRVVTRCLCWK